MKIWNYIFVRLQEPSTWRGIVLLATGLGANLSSESQSQIVTVGLSLTGLIGMFAPEKK